MKFDPSSLSLEAHRSLQVHEEAMVVQLRAGQFEQAKRHLDAADAIRKNASVPETIAELTTIVRKILPYAMVSVSESGAVMIASGYKVVAQYSTMIERTD